LGIDDADTAENDSGSRNCVIAPVFCALPRTADDPPTLNGNGTIRLVAGSRLQFIYGVDSADEGYFCSYHVNPDYVPRFEAAGIRIAAVTSSGEVRAVELPGHRFFIATLFHPQLGSRPGKPHPFVQAFVEAARAQSSKGAAS
jgi:CTP synthase (UTP-ammonia lyase)